VKNKDEGFVTHVIPHPARCLTGGTYHLDVGGKPWEGGPFPASVWLSAAAVQGHEWIVANLPGAPRYRWSRLAIEDPGLPVRHSRELLAAESGLDWWVAWRLMARSWIWVGVGGELAQWGVQPENVPLGRWLALTWRSILMSTDAKDRHLTESTLLAPPMEETNLLHCGHVQ